ncbi:MAG: hypothetical protein LUB61_03155, partial [Eggerthellaceae bacterium]|nr:hypothetical protein [Eggerthellaceae bacterium]
MVEKEVSLEGIPRTIELRKTDEGIPELVLIDQRKLPDELAMIETSDWRTALDAIKSMALRGAPALGLIGASIVTLRAWEFLAASGITYSSELMCHGTEEDGGCVYEETCRVNSEEMDEAEQEIVDDLDRHRTFVLDEQGFDKDLFLISLEFTAEMVIKSRPTAVNLKRGVDTALN